ncbi:MAG: undecaprenyl-diphosphate phosphatase [Anaeroplasmataceae bacterium]
MEWFYSFIYGIVEGLTEWLPISSTGHLILLREWFDLNISEQFFELFLVVIQLGAIIAVILLFFKKLCPFGFGKTKEEKVATWKLWVNVLIACVPAAIIGLFLDDLINEYFYNFITVALMLIVYGILFIVIEVFNKKREFKVNDLKSITWKTALIIGMIQLLALIPGTSRSGVTILGAMLIGFNRTVSIEFSFFLSIPVMLGASLLKGFKYLMEFGFPSGYEIGILLVGCITAFVVSIIVIKFLLKFIKKYDFKAFGYYRIVLGIFLLIYFFSVLV